MASFILSLTELANIRIRGRTISIRASSIQPATPAPALPILGEEPGPEWLLPRPLGSHTPDDVMIGCKWIEDYRMAELVELHGDHLYPRALASLLRASGTPIGKVEGQDPWEIVRAVDPDVYDYLRTLGGDPDLWKPLRIDVKAAKTRAYGHAHRAANPKPGDPERPPDFVDRMMQAGTTANAAAWCARAKWRTALVQKAEEEEIIDLDSTPAVEPVHG